MTSPNLSQSSRATGDLPGRLRLVIARTARRLRQASRAACATFPRRTWRRWSAPRTCSSGCSRATVPGRRGDGGGQPHVRLAPGAELPTLLRRSDRLAERQLDADRRGDVADPAVDG